MYVSHEASSLPVHDTDEKIPYRCILSERDDSSINLETDVLPVVLPGIAYPPAIQYDDIERRKTDPSVLLLIQWQRM